MQIDFDMDVLMGAIQRAAVRRGMVVGYMVMDDVWTVTDLNRGGEIVGRNACLEKIFDVLDEHPITIEGVLIAAAMEKETE